MRKVVNWFRSNILELLLFCALMFLLASYGIDEVKMTTLSFENFKMRAEKGEVDYVVISRSSPVLTVYFKDGSSGTMLHLGYDGFIKDIADLGVNDIRVLEKDSNKNLTTLISTVVFILLAYALVKYFVKSSEIISSRAKGNQVESKSVVTFNDVAGLEEEKRELIVAIDSLKNRDKIVQSGARPIRGILLEGPPGVGKTLLAKAVAGEAGVNFLSYSGSGFNELFVGMGAARVRAMYKKAIESKPCVVFIDEIDSIGESRISNGTGGAREHNNTLTALLEFMDGIGSEDGILFIGATNRVEDLDPALLRPGRFDKVIHISPPVLKKDREEIIKVHLKGKKLADGVDLSLISSLCTGLSGAEIESVLNDAVLESVREGKDGIIYIEHIDRAVMKILARGVEKGEHTGERLWRVAVHEAGHALMNVYLGRKVLKISVKPYTSGVGGVTIVDGDSVNFGMKTKEELLDDLKVLYAGMVAEKVVFGNFSNGNANDLEKATQILYNMVACWGMGDDSLVSMRMFGRLQPVMSQDVILSKMNSIAKDVENWLFNFMSDNRVKENLLDIAKRLEKEEVIYNLDMSFNEVLAKFG